MYFNGTSCPCTACTVKVTEVFFGENIEETIKVYEPGALLTDEQSLEFVGEEERAEYASVPINALMMGYEYSHTGDKVIFFLVDSVVEDGAYETAGAVQGKLTFDGEKYNSNTPEKLCEKSSYTYDEFKEYIK